MSPGLIKPTFLIFNPVALLAAPAANGRPPKASVAEAAPAAWRNPRRSCFTTSLASITDLQQMVIHRGATATNGIPAHEFSRLTGAAGRRVSHDKGKRERATPCRTPIRAATRQPRWLDRLLRPAPGCRASHRPALPRGPGRQARKSNLTRRRRAPTRAA